MTRLMLLIVLGLVATYYIPESRAALVDAFEPVLRPAFRWQAKQEMNRIAHEVEIYERDNYGRLPDSRRFPTWLEANFTEGAAEDSWGGQYLLFVERDSFVVVSWGPDQVPRSTDDLREARVLSRSLR